MALREFAPNNILYYEGSKFMVAKTKVPVGGIEGEYKRVSVCANCGYYHDGDFRDTCENCGAEIKPDAHGNVAKLTRVLPMETAIARRRERITCDEEERLKYGYNITTHFRYASQKRESAIVQASDGTPLFKLTYGATATIWRINRGLKRNQFDHALINRHLIKPWLDLLLESSVITQVKGLSRDQQYQKLLEQTDPNSDFERVVLQEIYQRGYKLPDAAQKFIPEANCKPDFVYEEDAIAIFCDGSVHDSPDQRKQDKIERDNLRYETGYTVLSLSHSEGWQTELLVLASL